MHCARGAAQRRAPRTGAATCEFLEHEAELGAACEFLVLVRCRCRSTAMTRRQPARRRQRWWASGFLPAAPMAAVRRVRFRIQPPPSQPACGLLYYPLTLAYRIAEAIS